MTQTDEYNDDLHEGLSVQQRRPESRVASDQWYDRLEWKVINYQQYGKDNLSEGLLIINNMINLSEGLSVINNTTNLSEGLPVIDNTIWSQPKWRVVFKINVLKNCVIASLCGLWSMGLLACVALDLCGCWPVWPMTYDLNSWKLV